jgi:HK97 gp10 family phage protein
MANPLSINIEGLDALLKGIDEKAKALTNDIGDEILATSYDIERDAKMNVSKNYAGLASSINAMRTSQLSAEVAVQKHYAAYVEFGTGTLVDVPSGLEEYAIQFKGKGIRKVNLPARPYIFPAVSKNIPKLIQRIKEIISK